MDRLDFEVFSLRDHERVTLLDGRPDAGRFIAVMARSVSFPDGPAAPVRDIDGAPVESAAIVAAQIQHEKQAWQWLQLAAPTKEHIGDMLFDNGADRDRWYFLQIVDLVANPELAGAAST